MARINLTLDDDTYERLRRHARRHGMQGAAAARVLIVEGLERRAAAERKKKLAADYAAGRADARLLLRDLEAGQWELLGDDEA